MANLKQTMELHDLELPEDQRTKVKHYCQVLWELNKTLNLTRHTTYDKFVTRDLYDTCLLYTSPSPRDRTRSRMPSSA